MEKAEVNSQLNNLKTNLMYLRQCRTLAENVFCYKNLPEYIDIAYVNKVLVDKGSIAWFYDDGLESVIALPWSKYGNLDVYNRPNKIAVYGQNGYYRVLNRDEYVIMYDNYGKYPLLLDIIQYAQRLGNCTRVQDINVAQQKTPRWWKTKTGKEVSIQKILNKVDSDVNSILTYDDIDKDQTQSVLDPAPYVTDKLDIHKTNVFNEFLRLIGISSLTVQKKERSIKDEILASQGGTIASRFSRFEPRKRAIDEINEKFKKYLKGNIEVKFFDGLPTSLDSFEENVENEIESENFREEEE